MISMTINVSNIMSESSVYDVNECSRGTLISTENSNHYFVLGSGSS